MASVIVYVCIGFIIFLYIMNLRSEKSSSKNSTIEKKSTKSLTKNTYQKVRTIPGEKKKNI